MFTYTILQRHLNLCRADMLTDFINSKKLTPAEARAAHTREQNLQFDGDLHTRVRIPHRVETSVRSPDLSELIEHRDVRAQSFEAGLFTVFRRRGSKRGFVSLLLDCRL